MEALACSQCSHGQLSARVSCDNCRKQADLETVLQYERVTFLLEETVKPGWQRWLPPEEQATALRPYRQNQRDLGFRLGLIPLSNLSELKVRGWATEYLLKDAAEIELQAPNKLMDFVIHERGLILAEYAYRQLSVPMISETSGLDLRRLTWESCLNLLQAGNRQINPADHEKMAKLYRERIRQVEQEVAEIAAREAEAARRRQEEWEAAEQKRLAAEQAALEQNQPVAASPAWTGLPIPQIKLNWEKIQEAVLSDVILRTLLYLGALFVVMGAGIFATLNWRQFPPLIQISMLLSVDLAFFGASIFTVKVLKLRRAGLTFLAISAAILPLAIYGYSRAELLNLDNRGTWSWVSWLTLPCYLGLTWIVRDKLLSFMCCAAGLSAWWALLFQLGFSAEWLAPATIPVAVMLVWLDGKLRANPSTAELADAPFWVGQITVVATAAAIFSYYLRTPKAGELFQYVLGLHWWLVVAFYGWCVGHSSTEKLFYRYALAFSGLVAFYLTLQKLPFPADWQGFWLGALGLSYLAWQNLDDLVSHLNYNYNRQPWHLSEVFAARKPFSTLGWATLLGGTLLSSWLGSEAATAANFGLIAVALAGATLIYQWKYLGWFAVGSALFGYFLAVSGIFGYFLAQNADRLSWGLALVVAALVGFGLWLVARRKPHLNYFSRPLELAGHLSAAFVPVNFYLMNRNLFSYRALDVLRNLAVLDWLVLAGIYAGLSVVYRRRVGLDFGLLIMALVLAGKWAYGAPLRLMVVGVALAFAGFVLTQLPVGRLRDMYGLALQQWGYGLAIAALGIELTLDKSRTDFVTVVGLGIVLAFGTAWAAYHGRLLFWQKLYSGLLKSRAESLRHIAASIWLYPAFGLLPLWLEQVFGAGGSGWGMAGLSLLYFGAALGLARFGAGSTFTRHFGPYSYPALLGWVALGVGALYKMNETSYADSILVSLALSATAALAAVILKEWRFNWLVVNFLPWANWKLWQLSGLELFWQPLFIAAIATLMLAIGECLNGRPGKPYRMTAHQQTAASVLVSLLMYATTFTSINNTTIIKIALSAMLLLLIPYSTLALLRRQPVYVYPLGLITSLAAIIWGKCAWLWLEWPIIETTMWSFLAIALIAALLYPFSLKVFPVPPADRPRKSAFPPRAVLSQMSHFWTGLAILFALAVPGSLSVVLAAAVLLYLLRSYHEQRPWLLALSVGLSAWFLWHSLHWTSVPNGLNGLALVGLAAFFMASGLFIKRRNSSESSRFKYNRRAWQICYAAGLHLYVAGLLLSTEFRLVSRALYPPGFPHYVETTTGAVNVGLPTTLALGLMGLMFGLMAWLEQRKWAYLALGNFLAAYILSFMLSKTSWEWFGVALLLPAALTLGIGLKLASPVGPMFQRVALGLLLVGLPFAWRDDRLMVVQTFILTLVCLSLFRLSGKLQWLYGTLVFGTYAGLLAIYLSPILTEDWWSAAQGLAVLQMIGMLYLASDVRWLDNARRWHAVTLLSISSQVVALFGLYLSSILSTNTQIAWNLAALAGLSLVNLLVTRRLIWLYAGLFASHLTYLAILRVVVPFGLTLEGLAFALLTAGVMMALFAVRLGYVTENLQGLATRLRHEKLLVKNLLHLKSIALPFYLMAALDLTITLVVANGETLGIKLVIGSSVALCLGLAAIWERSKPLAWMSQALVVAGAFYLASKVAPGFGVVGLALIALALTSAGYGLVQSAAKVLAQPMRQAAHITAGGATLWWSYHFFERSRFEAWQSFSWLLGLVGLNYLMVSLLESRRRTADENVDKWRYLSYGSILLIEGWFSLQLGLGSVGQLQVYVIPLGLLLLAFGWQERNGHNPRLTNLLESLGLVILLGTTLLQAFGLQTLGLDKSWYGGWLLVEALLVLGFGALRGLRYYFFGGLTALLLDAVALMLDPVRAADKWLVLGLTGLTLIALALFLERKREMVLVLSRNWFTRLSQWE